MPHLVLPSLTAESKQFSIGGSDAHHWVRVLRAKVGDFIQLNNGQGLRAEGRIIKVDLSVPFAEGEITRIIDEPQKAHRLHLLQGLPRGAKFDFVIEKATELGVTSIIPFLSEKNPIELDDSQEAKKLSRWEKVAEAAAKQSGTAIAPMLNPVLRFKQLIKICKERKTFLLHPTPKNKDLKQQIQGKMLPAEINIVVGPESGFSEQEVKQLIAADCEPVSLGERILRTETAGLTIISIFNYELGLF